MNEFDNVMQKMSEAAMLARRGIAMIVEAFAEAINIVFPPWIENIVAHAPTLIEIANNVQLHDKGRVIAPRVTYLAFYSKKKRIRKKNLNRLKKILQER